MYSKSTALQCVYWDRDCRSWCTIMPHVELVSTSLIYGIYWQGVVTKRQNCLMGFQKNRNERKSFALAFWCQQKCRHGDTYSILPACHLYGMAVRFGFFPQSSTKVTFNIIFACPHASHACLPSKANNGKWQARNGRRLDEWWGGGTRKKAFCNFLYKRTFVSTSTIVLQECHRMSSICFCVIGLICSWDWIWGFDKTFASKFPKWCTDYVHTKEMSSSKLRNCRNWSPQFTMVRAYIFITSTSSEENQKYSFSLNVIT